MEDTSEQSLASLREAISACPLIDNHAHNLLTWEGQEKYPLESITTEAGGDALQDTRHSLAHIRAVKQLSAFYDCPPAWESIKEARTSGLKRDGPGLMRRALAGTHTLLIDDGLDGAGVFSYDWHSQFTTGPTKRIVRIEHVAQELLLKSPAYLMESHSGLKTQVDHRSLPKEARDEAFTHFMSQFSSAILDSFQDPNVVGFKSVICYRTGLNISGSIFENRETFLEEECRPAFGRLLQICLSKQKARIEDKPFNNYLVVFTLSLLSEQHRGSAKPLQFHTGLGDPDINLTLSNPAHLQDLIEAFPGYPIILLHSSYPFTREAGYLATVFKNVFLDVGEVFPMLSREGQESVLRQSLEQVPTNKILWSTDGHWFPETYYLANLQVREALDKVLVGCVQEGDLTVQEATSIVENILFKNSSRVYSLGLDIPSYSSKMVGQQSLPEKATVGASKYDPFQQFISNHPGTKLIRAQWIDNLGIVRTRIIPVARFAEHLRTGKGVRITLAATGLLPGDNLSSNTSSTGQMSLDPDPRSLRPHVSEPSHAVVMCSWVHFDGSPVEHCSRSLLNRVLNTAKGTYGAGFLIGFEIEFVFLEPETQDQRYRLVKGTHNWSTYHPSQRRFMKIVEDIVSGLTNVGIGIEQFHAEGAPGQYEIVLSPLPPIEAIDALLFARQTIKEAAAANQLVATFIPYPINDAFATGAHAHISLSKTELERPFFGGVLRRLQALQSFCLPQQMSYKRVSASTWGSGTWIGWGTQNREMSLRRIDQGRCEVRFLDGTTNMYLAFAGIIAAGLMGIDMGSDAEFKDCPYDPAKMTDDEREEYGIVSRLVPGVRESLFDLDADAELKDALGHELVEKYMVLKREEQDMLGEMEETERKIWLIERY